MEESPLKDPEDAERPQGRPIILQEGTLPGRWKPWTGTVWAGIGSKSSSDHVRRVGTVTS